MIIVGCMIGLWIVGKIFSIPLKAIFKLVMNSILGGLLIFIINLIGGAFSFHIGLNVGTSLLVGILGIPRCYFINYIKNIYIKTSRKDKALPAHWCLLFYFSIKRGIRLNGFFCR